MAVTTSGFFFDIFQNLGSDKRWQLLSGQYAIDDFRRNTRRFMVAFQNRPGGAPGQPERFGLLLERDNSGGDENLFKLSDLGRLSPLRFRAGLLAT